jgi:CRP-like cAMP-binding protein
VLFPIATVDAGAPLLRPQWLRERQTLYTEGAPSLAVHVVCSGRVKVSRIGWRAEEFILEIIEPGSNIGLVPLLTDGVASTSAEAMERTQVRSIDRATFEDALARSPDVALRAIHSIATRLQLAHERLVELAQRDVFVRTAHLLATLLDESPVSPGTDPEIRMRRMDLAHLVGTTPETISRTIHKLRDRGVLVTDHDCIRVLDPRKLRAIAGVLRT